MVKWLGRNKYHGYMGRSSWKYFRCWLLKGPFFELTPTGMLLGLPFSTFHHCLVRFPQNFPINHTFLSSHEREPDCHLEKGGSTFLPNVQWLPRNFVRGEGVQQIQLRTEDRENGDLRAVAH